MEPPAPPAAAADALSSLPNELVDDSILTRLDLRDVVRTSALSRAWQHRWESLPALSLCPRDGSGTPPAIVDSVLNSYAAGRIPNFSVRVNSQFERRAEGWLIDLSHRDVQSMDVRGDDDCVLKIHSKIYSFSHLVTLKLHKCEIPTRTEGFAGFLWLKKLELVEAHLSVKDLEAIVGGSPLLDALMLSDVYVLNNELELCVIEAPNLRSLTIISVVIDGWQFGGLPRLDNASIDLDTFMYVGDFVQFLAGVAHARQLALPTFYLLHFGDETLLGTLPYKFVNLRSLFLCTHFCESYSILATFFLLRNAPNLEELDITINGDQEKETEANTEFLTAQWTNAMSPSLQVVTINDISCLSNEMCFIELVLSKVTMLRTMSITLGDEFSRSDEDVINELKAYRRASPHAQILLQKASLD